MKFDRVAGNLLRQTVKDASLKFRKLMSELAIRDTNYHVGSGLGGNNFQLFTLINIAHNLSDTVQSIVVKDHHITWGANWLATTRMAKIRAELDAVYPSIREHFKYEALLADTITKSPNTLREIFLQRKEHFPILNAILKGKSYRYDSNLSSLEQLVLAIIMCTDLSERLDASDSTLIKPVGVALYDFPPEIILLSVRFCVGIERIVRFNLDEDPVFMLAIAKVTNLVD